MAIKDTRSTILKSHANYKPLVFINWLSLELVFAAQQAFDLSERIGLCIKR